MSRTADKDDLRSVPINCIHFINQDHDWLHSIFVCSFNLSKLAFYIWRIKLPFPANYRASAVPVTNSSSGVQPQSIYQLASYLSSSMTLSIEKVYSDGRLNKFANNSFYINHTYQSGSGRFHSHKRSQDSGK